MALYIACANFALVGYMIVEAVRQRRVLKNMLPKK